MAPGLESLAGPNEEFLQYLEGDSVESAIKALQDLERLVDEEGPFDGVMAFSQAAAMAATFILRSQRKDPEKHGPRPVFRCAVFFCGGVPVDPSDLQDHGTIRPLNVEKDGEVIHIPTAHIWGHDDQLYPTFGPVLSKLCCGEQRADFIHQGGHEIPGAKSPSSVVQAARAIKRAIEMSN
ncbi:hypothetical protein NUW58_g9396 [Xylaria curta]|uniref:Uncharacterized protein n=1 Tax=Xylaria curta TaxID=42375 RepID=A0ACC1MXF1_9PEZI|nr:hypothetical protein NUW58_g9396 [Xylaria curta]